MWLYNRWKRKKQGVTRFGCIWEEGAYTSDTDFVIKTKSLSKEARKLKAIQTRVTAYWPDGSIKWTSHTAKANELTDAIEVVPLEIDADHEKLKIGKSPLAQEQSVQIDYLARGYRINNGVLSLTIDTQDRQWLFENLIYKGKEKIRACQPVLIMEELEGKENKTIKTEAIYSPTIKAVKIEDQGPIELTIKFTGIFSDGSKKRIPFVIRMKIDLGDVRVRFTYSFLYDGDEKKDFLKGIGVDFKVPMEGELFNRHIKFEVDHGIFHEPVANLVSWQPRVSLDMRKKQMEGQAVIPDVKDQEVIDAIIHDMPYWGTYDFCQDFEKHFRIKKKLSQEEVCYLNCLDGQQSDGGAALGRGQDSILFSIRDFWEKYPSGYTFEGLDQDVASIKVWLWSPSSQAMDYRHYAKRGYNKVCYEGYDYYGATPYGIGNTSEFAFMFSDELIPDDRQIKAFSYEINHPLLYIGKPEAYHALKAFGYWSLPSYETEVERWIEAQLKKAVDFYKNEVKQRAWYGMYDYGDFMHTYDSFRHGWFYDVGGYAWDNTELMPTLWLWYSFLRTGDEETFELAAHLSRHTSEVDVYHMGKLKGLGSRHNVRHWGCPCKEARIAMAGHHRVYYYLTGDRRFEDIFEELKDNEEAFYHKDPMGSFYDPEKMQYPSHIRSGPDWSSLCSNWMTRWERMNDQTYKEKILQGIRDIEKAPLKLASGTVFEFDPKDVSLHYIGEQTKGGSHLQICMGACQTWLELGLLLKDHVWDKMLADLGTFYFASREEQLERSKGIIGDREFTFPFMASTIGAYGARYYKDEDLAKKIWRILLGSHMTKDDIEGFQVQSIENTSNKAHLEEIPWISTNFVSQWCMNSIVVLALIKEYLPETIKELVELIESEENKNYRLA